MRRRERAARRSERNAPRHDGRRRGSISLASVDSGGGGRRVRAYPQISVASGGRARVRSDAPWSTRPSFVVSLACKCPPRRPMAHTSTRPQRAPAAMAPTHQTTRLQRQGDREVQAVSGEVSALLTSVSGASGSAVSPHRICHASRPGRQRYPRGAHPRVRKSYAYRGKFCWLLRCCGGPKRDGHFIDYR